MSGLLLVLLALGTGCARVSTGRFPIGIYAPGSQTNLPTLRDAGFSHVRAPASPAFLDAAHAAGIRVLATPATPAGPRFNPAQARAAVRKWDSHPALWAWYLSDEPDLNGIDPEQVEQARDTVRAAGARKPTALVVYRGPSLAYFHSADILMVDRYPVGWQPLATFFQHMRHGAVAARVGGRSFVAVIQAFDWSFYSDIHPFPEPITPRAPTAAELRCMTWGARLIGADGIFYYCFEDGRWRIRDHPSTWEALGSVVREIRDRENLYTAKRVGLPPRSELLEPSLRFNEVLEPSLMWSVVRVETATPNVPAGTYWILVNTTAEWHQLRLLEPQWAGLAVPDLDLGRTRPIDREGWMEALQPFEVRLLGPLPDTTSSGKGDGIHGSTNPRP